MNAIRGQLELDKVKDKEHKKDFFCVYCNEKESPEYNMNVTLLK